MEESRLESLVLLVQPELDGSTPPRCESCGKWGPTESTPLGSQFCAACRESCREFLCRGCGAKTRQFGKGSQSEVDICWRCEMKQLIESIPEADREAIRSAIKIGMIPGIKVARERLGLSIPEAMHLVETLRTPG